MTDDASPPPEPWPITIETACARLHCSKDWLYDHLKRAPCGRRVGRRIVFFEDDWAQLIASFTRLDQVRSGTAQVAPPSAQAAYDRLMARAAPRIGKGRRARGQP